MVNNTKYGSGALQNNTGTNNTAIGAYTAYNNLDASNNTAVGSNSSFFNTTGSNNTALGAGSLCNNTTGALNTAIGSSALEGVAGQSVGNQNVAVGAQALYVNNGDLNTAIGSYAAEEIDSSYNTFLGAYTSFNDTSSSYQYSTAIGYGAQITDSNQIMMGGTGSNGYPNIVIPGKAFLPNFDFNTATETQIVPKEYVDAAALGLAPKAPCKCVATDGVTIGPTGIYIDSTYSTLYTIDGYTTSINDRVLINNQGPTGPSGNTGGIGNGIYVVGGTAGNYSWTRSTDMPLNSDALGAYTFVENGNTYKATTWVQSIRGATGSPVLVGATGIYFVKTGGFPFRIGRGLETSVDSTLTYINVDTSLNFINYLDSTAGAVQPGGATGGSGTLNIGNNTTQTIIGPTGGTGNPVIFPSGITGPTGSFQNLTVANQIQAPGGITGGTGSFTNIYVGITGQGGTIHFAGTSGDIGAASDASFCIIQNRVYTSPESSELLLFKANDVAGVNGPDRIRLRAAAIAFDTYSTTQTSPVNPYIESVRMYVDQNGNVGIGTTGPAYPLDVSGNINTNSNIILKGTQGSNNHIMFNTQATTSDWAQINWNSQSDGDSYLQFGTWDNAGEPIIFTQHNGFAVGGPTGDFERMRIDKNGVHINVPGITGFTGISSYSLEVSGNIITTQGITGPTGSFQDLIVQNQIKAPGGITGATGSFDNIKIGLGGDIGVTGTVLDVSGSAVIANNIYNDLSANFGYALGVVSNYATSTLGVINSTVGTLSKGYEFGYIGSRGQTFTSTTAGKNFIGIYPDAINTGNYNPITQQSDHLIIVGRYGYTGGVDVSGGLVICPWSGTASGARMDISGNFTFYNPITASQGITGPFKTMKASVIFYNDGTSIPNVLSSFNVSTVVYDTSTSPNTYTITLTSPAPNTFINMSATGHRQNNPWNEPISSGDNALDYPLTVTLYSITTSQIKIYAASNDANQLNLATGGYLDVQFYW